MWDDVSSAGRFAALPARSLSDVMTTVSLVHFPDKCLLRQFVSEPVVGGENLLGSSLKCYAQVQDVNGAFSETPAFGLSVCDLAGTTIKATIIPAFFTYGSGAPFSVPSLRNAAFYSSAPIAVSYVLEPLDRVVIELGFNLPFQLPQPELRTRYGASASSDLPENETETQDLNPWIEFSTDFALLSDSIGATVRGTNVPTVTIGGRNGP
jgi:hypothetical protein